MTIDEDADGRIDLEQLERELIAYADRPFKIGSFSAASNVTGIGTKTAETAILLHKHGALSFWDFAAAGPYVEIDMNLRGEGPDGHLAYKDAVFISPHKFIGGPGTPGILVAKKHLFKNRVPTVPGGGTVAYVNEEDHRYYEDIQHREEGGTPAIVGSIRAGLVFQLKQAVGADAIHAREERFIRRAIETWSEVPSLRILGNPDLWRLSIVSFMVRHPDGTPERYLHHNYVVALLNDLFGIQARGGCSCAGPYGHRLLGIDLTQSREFEREILRGSEGVKPGWVRVNFNYFLSETVFDYLIRAVSFVAEHGWKLLPWYDFVPETGLWRHRARRHHRASSLRDISYACGRLEYPTRHATAPEAVLPGYLERAHKIVAEAELRSPRRRRSARRSTRALRRSAGSRSRETCAALAASKRAARLRGVTRARGSGIMWEGTSTSPANACAGRHSKSTTATAASRHSTAKRSRARSRQAA